MLRIFLFLIGSILLFWSGAQAADRTLRLAPGERASIALKENPSTGYSWRIDKGASSNLAIVRIEDGGFTRDGGDRKPPLVGAPGVHRWTVEALSKGRARIEFVYERPWERKPVERHRVNVDAR